MQSWIEVHDSRSCRTGKIPYAPRVDFEPSQLYPCWKAILVTILRHASMDSRSVASPFRMLKRRGWQDYAHYLLAPRQGAPHRIRKAFRSAEPHGRCSVARYGVAERS